MRCARHIHYSQYSDILYSYLFFNTGTVHVGYVQLLRFVCFIKFVLNVMLYSFVLIV